MVTQPQVFFLDAQIQQEVLAVASPILEPFEVGIWFAEEFQFHLFKFPNTEDEVTWCNFVPERFTNLTNAERNFFPSGSLDVCEVYKNTLSRFRTQIQFRLRVFCNALEGLEHQVKLPNVSEIRLSAIWTRNLLFPDVVHHFFIRPASRICTVKVFNQVICSVASLAGFAVHERVREATEVTGSDPSLWIHQNGTVQTDIIGAFLNELLPPSPFDIIFQFDTEWAIIPSVGKSAVDFRTGIYKASGLTKVNDFVHAFFLIGQHYNFLISMIFCTMCAGLFLIINESLKNVKDFGKMCK